VTVEEQKGSWKVEDRTSQAYEKSKLSASLFTKALNGLEWSACDLTYDDRWFENDRVYSEWLGVCLIDPTGRQIDLDIIDTDPQAELI
jgi:hypothetical protein